ncbi:G-type lectin S-receptor-like serine/threonine-protein kinase SD2-5 [Castanea sativa]|uniref:G-type lectin S-receptor-like serine/threonine-protein kinase SD2-5 n=1 Tax=Castanea sativa TaxID=21020 RepID=UPI003F6492CD
MGISGSWACCGFLLYLLAVFLTPFRTIGTALPRGSLSPNSSTSWSTSFSAPNNTVKFDDGSIARSILVSENVEVFPEPDGRIEYACGCGFFCNPPCNSFLFATFVLYYYKDDSGTSVTTAWGPHVVWSANPKNPVNANATLQFKSKGGLVLRANGTEAWSAKITNKYVASLNLTDTCNLMLLNKNDETIWQSYEHPTDTLFRGQQLQVGKSLTSKEGLFSLNITSEGIFAYINSNPPQLYYSYNISGSDTSISGIEFQNGSIALLDSKKIPRELELPGRSARFARYARFENDGHLRVYTFGPTARDDILLATQLYSCDFPTACGNYGVCENKGESCKQCTCLPDENKNGTSYFKAIDVTEPDKGCTPVTNLSCEGEALDRHTFLEVKNITNFPFRAQDPHDIKPDHRSISSEKCKEECQKRNCSCKAAIYYYKSGSSTGDCYLESQIFSMMKPHPEELQYPSMLFKIWIRVQDVKEQSVQRQKHGLKIIVGSSITFGLFLLIGSFVFLIWKKRSADEGDEYYLDHIPGMSTRYSYDDLQSITANFNKELGAGGFGTVFEGTLIDGSKVAVKRLDGLNQIKRSFLAEVETIGSIHHFNLVRLIGFCAEKSHRLLVYEYMSNGSLDKWVFDKNPEIFLDWQHKKNIILDIARGLTYLHEDCRQKIVHLDIKPQNILLDENFNAKVSDFGLSKLVDRDQSQVVTVMRGTPGYMAPEWLSSVITEKVDVYSFGVVLLEILCGRRNLDRSQPEETMHLLHLFKKKIEEDQLLDLVDKYNEDMQLHGVEVVNIMRIAAWCLQIDFTKRPSMSTVVKVLEGVVNVEYDLGYFFSNPLLPSTSVGVDNQQLHVGDSDTTQLLPSILSGPR